MARLGVRRRYRRRPSYSRYRRGSAKTRYGYSRRRAGSSYRRPRKITTRLLTSSRVKYVKKRVPSKWIRDFDGTSTVLRSLAGLPRPVQRQLRSGAKLNLAQGQVERATARLNKYLYGPALPPAGVAYGNSDSSYAAWQKERDANNPFAMDIDDDL